MQTVLVVDDQEVMRHLGKAMVEWCGYSAMEAASGAEAIETFQLHRDDICCVLLDMTMPGLSGEGTFQALRQIQSDLPILVISGVVKEEWPDFLRGQAFVDFVRKPCALQEFRRSLGNVLNSTPRYASARREER